MYGGNKASFCIFLLPWMALSYLPAMRNISYPKIIHKVKNKKEDKDQHSKNKDSNFLIL